MTTRFLVSFFIARSLAGPVGQGLSQARRVVGKLSTLKALIALLAVLLCGCATGYKLPTASGLPEVSISAPAPKVRTALSRLMADAGNQLVQESAGLMVFEGQASGAATFWFGNLLTGQKPMMRARFNLVEGEGALRVTASLAMVHQAGLGGTSEMQFDERKPREELQRFLVKLKAEAEK